MRAARLIPVAAVLLGACAFAYRSHRQTGGALLHPNDFVIQVAARI